MRLVFWPWHISAKFYKNPSQDILHTRSDTQLSSLLCFAVVNIIMRLVNIDVNVNIKFI